MATRAGNLPVPCVADTVIDVEATSNRPDGPCLTLARLSMEDGKAVGDLWLLR